MLARWKGELIALAGIVFCLVQVARENVWQFGLVLALCAVFFGALIACDARAYRRESRRPGYIIGGRDGD